jgi:fucose 4-O-acetylase-like acetyltransferase
MPWARTLDRSSDARRTSRSVTAVAAAAVPGPRLLFIDNVRWAMIVLVLGMHAAVTYSPLGSWYYREHPAVGPLGTLFFATFQGLLQGFFMALLFFVAGYFARSSYDAKGAGGFMAGRLRRLGLPTLLFMVALGPLTTYLATRGWRDHDVLSRLGAYFASGQIVSGTGPMWFCAALLVFCAGYIAFRTAPSRSAEDEVADPPGARSIAVVVAAIAFATFVVRLWQPLGSSVLNLQLCYFPSYVVMFGLGAAAHRGRWLERIGDRFARRTAAVCVGAALLMWLPLLLLGGALQGRQADYSGGPHWQAAALALWETLVCVGTSFGVLAFFRDRLGRQRRLSKFMSANAFAVYVIHPPILVGLALLLAPVAAPPIAKFALLWTLGLVVCFGLAAPLARRIPALGDILQ